MPYLRDAEKSKSLDNPIEKHQPNFLREIKNISQSPSNNNTKKKAAKQRTVTVNSHTEADVNWAYLINKVSMPNIVKGGMTFGGGCAGSFCGAGLCTGIGLALMGPGGAVIGYHIGSTLGFGVGVVGGNKVGKIVANQLKPDTQNEMFDNGKSKVTEDTESKSVLQKEEI